MTIRTESEMFARDLQKLYHAEIEILDLHKELAEAVSTEELISLYEDHRNDTIDQINRIEGIFNNLEQDPSERASQIMEGVIAEKDEFIGEVKNDELRELDAIGIGMINERFEITILDRLILLARTLELSDNIISELERNRAEARDALSRMQQILDKW